MKKRFPRLYPILDTTALLQRGCADWTPAADAMIEGGIEILQFRHKGDWTRSVFEQAQSIAALCHREDVPFIINDRADMARLLDAGAHLGQDDLSPADCRKVIDEAATLGFSTHNADQLSSAAKEPISYLAFGPVFATASKERPDPVVGLRGLASARSSTSKPLVAIGGITRQNAHEVFEAGVDSVALIGDLLPHPFTLFQCRQRILEWQRLLQN